MRGGEIVAEGTPEAVAANVRSFTGAYLKPMLAKAGTAKKVRAREAAEQADTREELEWTNRCGKIAGDEASFRRAGF